MICFKCLEQRFYLGCRFDFKDIDQRKAAFGNFVEMFFSTFLSLNSEQWNEVSKNGFNLICDICCDKSRANRSDFLTRSFVSIFILHGIIPNIQNAGMGLK